MRLRMMGLAGALALLCSPGAADRSGPWPSAAAPAGEQAPAATAAPPPGFDCRRDDFEWSAGRPPINLRHVFCGELDDDRPEGRQGERPGGRPEGRPKRLHATVFTQTRNIGSRLERRSDEGGGIYSAIVVFDGNRRKFLTFFPDHCSALQNVRSIEHAASNRLRAHKQWGDIGLSAPDADSIRGIAGFGHEMFCLDNKSEPFEIRLGVLADGRINTAFPN